MTDDERRLDVDDVLITDELNRRPSRAADFAAENRALNELARGLAEQPETVLQKLVDMLVSMDVAESAGVSLLEGDRFVWAALAGDWEHLKGESLPRDASPCGIVIDRNETLLMSHPERVFADARVDPLISEVLLVPIRTDGHAVGALWLLFHDEDRHFDREDARLLQNLAGLASAAHQIALGLEGARRAERDSEQRFRRIVENARDYAIFLVGPDERISDWLPGAEAVFGWTAEEAIGEPAAMTFTPEDRAADQPAKEIATAARDGVAPDVRWHQRKDGSRVFIDGIMTALTEPDGSIRDYLKIGQDVTERHAAEERQKLLLAELQHRVRNTLAVIRSIARRTAQGSDSVEEMGAHLEGRIDAFARVQAMVTRNPSGGVDLAALLEDELLAHAAKEGEPLRIDGPDILLASKPAEILSLAFHELATNAVKYGALGEVGGRLTIEWRLADGRLQLSWRETGVSTPEPTRRGFGMELLTSVIPYDLGAETGVDFGAGGFAFTLSMPADGNLRAR